MKNLITLFGYIAIGLMTCYFSVVSPLTDAVTNYIIAYISAISTLVLIGYCALYLKVRNGKNKAKNTTQNANN